MHFAPMVKFRRLKTVLMSKNFTTANSRFAVVLELWVIVSQHMGIKVDVMRHFEQWCKWLNKSFFGFLLRDPISQLRESVRPCSTNGHNIN